MTTPAGDGGTGSAGTSSAGRRRLIVAAGLLMSTTVTWRRATYYSGGVDPTVAAKAVLGLVAAVLAFRAARAASSQHRLNLCVPLYLVSYGLLSVFGAWATGGLLIASAVLFARLLLLAVTVLWLLRAFDATEVLKVFAFWLAAVTLVASATGGTAGTLRTGHGRLLGGIPPLLPNEIGELSALCVLLLLWWNLRGRGRSWHAPAGLIFLGTLWLSGSRTTLAFVLVAAVIMILRSRTYGFGLVLMGLVVVPLAVYGLFGTQAATDYVNRGGSTNIGSLSQRTVAWSAALHLHHGFWPVLFGNGLARTSIPVVAQFRTSQILDSTWISALVQGGLMGLVVLGAWVVHTVVLAARTVGERGSLYLALVLFAVGLSFLESGVIGATPVFVVFLIVGLTGGRGRIERDTEPSALQAVFLRARTSRRVAPV